MNKKERTTDELINDLRNWECKDHSESDTKQLMREAAEWIDAIRKSFYPGS